MACKTTKINGLKTLEPEAPQSPHYLNYMQKKHIIELFTLVSSGRRITQSSAREPTRKTIRACSTDKKSVAKDGITRFVHESC